jgi:hypothetical protein
MSLRLATVDEKGCFQKSIQSGHEARVLMDNLMKLVTTALEWTYAAGETDVTAQTLEAAAELLTLGRDAIRVIDRDEAKEPPTCSR